MTSVTVTSSTPVVSAVALPFRTPTRVVVEGVVALSTTFFSRHAGK